MQKEPTKRKTRYVSDFDDSGDICNAGSAKECTGLIPYIPKDEDVYEVYSAIYAISAWGQDSFN